MQQCRQHLWGLGWHDVLSPAAIPDEVHADRALQAPCMDELYRPAADLRDRLKRELEARELA